MATSMLHTPGVRPPTTDEPVANVVNIHRQPEVGFSFVERAMTIGVIAHGVGQVAVETARNRLDTLRVEAKERAFDFVIKSVLPRIPL